MKQGTIFFHQKFRFHNGELGKKFIILLNTPDLHKNEPYLFARTTTQQKNRIRNPRCDERLSTFFVPSASDFFKKDTWIQLHDIYPFDAKSCLRDKFDGHLEIRGELSEETRRQLLKCIKRMRDISERDKELIKP